MKVYVISDSAESSVMASNQINRSGHVALLSENVAEDSKNQLADLRANINSGFDVILMICGNAKDLAISANKIGGVMAVACKDHEDIVDAISETRANVIIIDSAKVGKSSMSSLVSAIVSGQKMEQKSDSKRVASSERETTHAPKTVSVHIPKTISASQDSAPEKTGSFLSSLKNAASNASSSISKQASRVKDAASPSDDGEGLVASIKKKGLAKSIKDTFGIED